MKTLLKITAINFLFLFFVGSYKAQNTLPAQPSLTIEQAKERLEQLQLEYEGIDETLNEKIEDEIAKQINTGPKGEFETTQRYKLRVAKIGALRKQLRAADDRVTNG